MAIVQCTTGKLCERTCNSSKYDYKYYILKLDTVTIFGIRVYVCVGVWPKK